MVDHAPRAHFLLLLQLAAVEESAASARLSSAPSSALRTRSSGGLRSVRAGSIELDRHLHRLAGV
jgi:hypothetical protein